MLASPMSRLYGCQAQGANQYNHLRLSIASSKFASSIVQISPSEWLGSEIGCQKARQVDQGSEKVIYNKSRLFVT